MATYETNNRGVLFDNDRKATPTHPDMRGSLNINGVDHWFDGWWKTGAKGDFLSLSIGKPKDAAPAPPAEATPVRRGNRPSNAPALIAKLKTAGSGFDDMDDDIPF